MLKKKPHVENQKQTAEKMLADRLENLRSKGIAEKKIQRDPKVRHIKAQVRQARHRLASIVNLEAEIVRRAEIRAQKLAGADSDHSRQKRSQPDPVKKRAKKERKAAAEVTETEE